jgi:hypothetical protein
MMSDDEAHRELAILKNREEIRPGIFQATFFVTRPQPDL